MACLAIVVASILLGPDRFYLTPFRESQTAITADYLARGESAWLRYETPVLGAPWSWPMEFPLYQWIVAVMHTAGMPLVFAGRLLSACFLAGCAWMAPRILGELLGTSEDWRWTRMLVWGSPLMLIYGTAFLIESTALFLSLGYLWLGLVATGRLERLVAGEVGETRRWGLQVAGCLACGAIAAAVKPTTWAPMAFVLGSAVIWRIFARAGRSERRAITVALTGIMLAIPLAAGLAWVGFADSVKEVHPVAESMVSSKMQEWNFGTLSQKLSPNVWSTILLRGWILGLGPAGILVPFVVLVALWRLRRELAVLVPVLVLLAAYVMAPLVFTNLHFRHDYYSFANIPFLLMALAVIAKRTLRDAWLARVGIAVGVSMALTTAGYLSFKQRYMDPQVDEVIAAIGQLKDDGALVLVGFGYSPVIPFETSRRALMTDQTEGEPRLEFAINSNRDVRFAAAVALNPRYRAAGAALAAELGIQQSVETTLPSGSVVWSREPIVTGSVADRSKKLHAYILQRVPAIRKLNDGVVWLRFPFSGKQGHGLELIYKRRSETFVVRSEGFEILRLREI